MSKRINCSRRDFLKTSALVTGAFALSPLAPLNKVFAQSIKDGKVITAAHWGPLSVTVKDGKVIKSEPVIKNSIENPLQSVVADQLYSKVRIKQPMVRKGFLDNLNNIENPDGKRGSDKFVPISWDEAYDLIENQIRRVRDTYGSEGIFAGSYGWRSSGVLHKAFTLMQRFFTASGGYVGHLGDYSTGAAQVIMPHVLGTVEVYEQPTSWEVVLKDSKVVVFWSANLHNTTQIAWGSSDCQGLDYLTKLKESNIKVLVIDPTYSETAEFLGDKAEWIPVNPTTDVPLMLGICHELIRNDWYDKQFLEDYCVGSDIVTEYILGNGFDKVEKTPEWAAEICGIPANKIRELAKLFHENRTMFMAGWAMQRQHHGEQTHWMLVTMAAYLGQIGLPGGGFGLSYHYSNGGVPEHKAGVLPNIGLTSESSQGSSANNKDWLLAKTELSFPVARIADALHNPGTQYPYNGEVRTFPHIKFIWWCGGNPFHHHQDLNRLRKGWQKPEVIIVSDPYWTATAKHADIVLPATTSYERNDLTMTGDYSNMHIVPMKKVVEPVGQAKDDLEVFTELSKRFGVEEAFTEGRDEMAWLAHFYNQAQSAARQQRIPMPKFVQFWARNEVYTNPVTEKGKNWVRYADFREDPILKALGTPSGKIELFSKTIDDMNYEDCRGHAAWLPPVEYLGNADEKYPLQMVTPHSHYRLHSQLNQTSLRKQYAVADREPVWLNKKDADARGIKDGDLVRIYNDRGQVLAGAVVNDRVTENVIALHEGAWYDPADGSDNALCKNGCGNVLAIDRGTSSLAQGNTGQTALVNVEKYTGEAQPLSAFTPPEGAS
ncbi:trimethylamine-N-oxide reductase TorA [Psychrobacter sp. FDAARGOS_221]|uniref:trimethylamine-N-oxide reductase TorA n=1 Tax=Psychrobacter sp. FDAARGOS_221 TaxID=1975705 RepID=UPI000BB54629|nr:trimethylamine-N-oxide reductase TorA [Psychrobacter sp. FDAARGOS_221]PNK60167.1 trimethylamine-N-oxide reductase TorA [Psychrobacter sp. FDAARGOS_221]